MSQFIYNVIYVYIFIHRRNDRLCYGLPLQNQPPKMFRSEFCLIILSPCKKVSLPHSCKSLRNRKSRNGISWFCKAAEQSCGASRAHSYHCSGADGWFCVISRASLLFNADGFSARRRISFN